MRKSSNKRSAIPPLTLVELISDSEEWRDQKGAIFRIGYYGRNDGLDCVWLVDDSGSYTQTVDQRMIESHFRIVERSNETDIFGDDRDPIGPRVS